MSTPYLPNRVVLIIMHDPPKKEKKELSTWLAYEKKKICRTLGNEKKMDKLVQLSTWSFVI